MESKKLTYVVEKNLVTVVERQTKVENFSFETPEHAKSWVEMMVLIKEDTWEVKII